MNKPAPEEIKAARIASGLTQTAAAELIGKTCRAWQYWEVGERPMDPALWELWQLKAAARVIGATSEVTQGKTPNPFPEGSPNENWRRGYEGIRHFGARDSEAARHWKMGRDARLADVRRLARTQPATPPNPAALAHD
jgi:putative transcriptional regulator